MTVIISFCLYFSGRGIADISAVVPDTITTWVASAYAMNRQTGLGVAPVPANVSNKRGILTNFSQKRILIFINWMS